MRKLTFGSIMLAALTASSAATAADMRVRPTYNAPPIVPVFSWAGCHVGANAGWIRSDAKLDLYPSGTYLAIVEPVGLAAISNTYGLDDSALAAGVQLGCNQQYGGLVLGIEADINWSGLDETISATYPAIPFAGGSWDPHTETVSHQLDWFSTLRVRAGPAFDRMLIYATGGFAVGRVKSSLNLLFPDGPFLFSGSEAKTRVGWTAGGGLEYAFTDNWTAKVEYLYLDLGRFSYESPLPNVLPAGLSWGTDVHSREHVVRVGVNYRFSDPIVRAAY